MQFHVNRLTIMLLACCALLSGPAISATPADGNKFAIPNTLVLDQYGKIRQFYADLVKDKIVAINFVFTRCPMVCPMLGFKFGRLRELLGPSAGIDVHLISITTDAPYDTPERLQAWAQQFNAGDGWTQVTGDKQNIDHVLKFLKAFSADKQDHSSLILLINDPLNEWKWMDGASDPQIIQAALSQWQSPGPNAALSEN